jgi:hypothetical protein
MQWNWEELANGIVLQAVKDYRASCRRARKRKTVREARMRIFRVQGGLLIGYTLKHSNTRNGGNGCDARAEGRKASTLRKVEGG